MSAASFDREIEVAVAAAREAADVVMDVYRRDFAVEFKDAREPVTLADRMANTLICERIAAAFPSDGIVAEESVPSDLDTLGAILRRSRVWFVDPLDGTKEFVARNGEFSVMIGLVVEGVPVMGVVAIPVTGELAVGDVARGAWSLLADGKRVDLRVSSTATVSASSLLLSRSHRSDRLERIAQKLAPARQVTCGSVGVKCVRIAHGTDELYVTLPSRRGARLWDACGPDAIVRAAGGRVTTVLGTPIDYRGPELPLIGGMVASNGAVHDEVIAVTSGAALPEN